MGGNVHHLRRPVLTSIQAVGIIREAARAGRVGWYLDGLVAMDARSLSSTIVMTVLADAPAVTEPAWDVDFGDWTIDLRLSASGRRLHVRVAIDADQRGVAVVASY